MPYVSNPLYGGGKERKEANIASAVESLGNIFSGGDPIERAKMMALGGGYRKDLAQAALDEDELAARTGLGGVFEGFMTPEGGMVDEDAFRSQTIKALPDLIRAGQGANVRDILSIPGIASGDDDLANMGSLFLRPGGANDAYSMDDREAVAARIAQDEQDKAFGVQRLENAGDLAVERIKPKSLDQLKAGTLESQYTPEELGSVFLTGEASDVTPRNVVLPGQEGKPGEQTVAIGNMFLDKDGQYKTLPYGSTVYSAQTSGKGPGEALGLTSATQTSVQKQLLALDSLDNTVNAIEAIAANPENFGTAGIVKSTAQDLIQQGGAIGQLLSDQSQQVQLDIMEREDTVSPAYFDPQLPALELLTNTLAYQYATGIAGNDRISDSDFTVAKQAVGDPMAWLGSAEKTKAKMATIRSMSQSRRAAFQNAVQNGVGGGGSAAPVMMRDPNGNLYEVDPAEAAEAEANGWSIEE